MKDFEYAVPKSIDEAIGTLSRRTSGVQFLAGGTDILVQLREGRRQADLVLDLKKIPELAGLQWRPDGGLLLGAAVPCARLYRDEKVRASYPALADAARIIGGWQIQSRASVGGNLCNASPAADSIPALIALGATCQIVGSSGQRTLAVEDFCVGPSRNALEPGEFLVALELPPPAQFASSRYIRFIPRNEMDIAVVGAGVWVRLNAARDTIEDARVGLAAVAPTPLKVETAAAVLRGKPPTEESFAAAAELAKEAARPISDMRGPSSYRKHLVAVLTRRALATAVERVSSAT